MVLLYQNKKYKVENNVAFNKSSFINPVIGTNIIFYDNSNIIKTYTYRQLGETTDWLDNNGLSLTYIDDIQFHDDDGLAYGYSYFKVSSNININKNVIVEIKQTDPVITEPIIFTGLNHNLGNSVYGIYSLKEGFTEAISYSCDNGSTIINHNAITKIKINGLKPSFTDLTLSLAIFTYDIILQKDVSGKVKLFIKQWTTLTDSRDYNIYTETGFNSDNVRFQTTIFYHKHGTEHFPTPASKLLNNCLIEFYDGRLLLTHYSDPSPGGSEDLKVINIVSDVTIYGIEADYIISDSFDTGVENILTQLDEEVEDAKQAIEDIQDDIIAMKEELDNRFNSFTQVYVSR